MRHIAKYQRSHILRHVIVSKTAQSCFIIPSLTVLTDSR